MHCLICPKCCELEVGNDKVSGAGCRRGEAFARQELMMPKRVVTTTLWVESKSDLYKVPVKTCEPVPIADISVIMKEIRNVVLKEKPDFGQIIRVSDLISVEVTGDRQ